MAETYPAGPAQPLGHHRRLAAGVVGLGLAVMLILLLDGICVGMQPEATIYAERAGVDLSVLLSTLKRRLP